LISATAVIFTQNHPPRVPQPGKLDISLNKCLMDTGALVDIRGLDHIFIGGRDTVSFTEPELLCTQAGWK
jgi:DNA repair protein RadC